jgi:hypothetical protein
MARVPPTERVILILDEGRKRVARGGAKSGARPNRGAGSIVIMENKKSGARPLLIVPP